MPTSEAKEREVMREKRKKNHEKEVRHPCPWFGKRRNPRRYSVAGTFLTPCWNTYDSTLSLKIHEQNSHNKKRAWDPGG
jgi:hypothetical protein